MTRRDKRMDRAHRALMEAVATRDPLAISYAAAEVNAAHAHTHNSERTEAVR